MDQPDPPPNFPATDLSLIAEVLRRQLGRLPNSLVPIPTYTDTAVVEAQVGDTAVIFKAADPAGLDPSRIALEAWVCERIRAAGVPAPAVLSIDTGCSLYPAPYFLMEKVRGQPLDKLDLPLADREEYVRRMGSLLRTVHGIEVGGYGWLDEQHYLAEGEVRGEEDSWYGAVERQVRPALQYLLDHRLIDPAGAEDIGRLLEASGSYLQAWQRSSLLHGDIGLNCLFVDGTEFTGFIDWGNRWAGDPIWDLVTFDWKGGRDFQWLLEGYEPDVPVAEILEKRLPLYTVFQAVPWVVWCHRRGHRRQLRVLPSVVRIARNDRRS